MSAQTRRGPAPAGRPVVSSASSNAATDTDRTSLPQPTRGAVLRLSGDAERMAADLLEKLGPAQLDALVSALAEVVGHDGPPETKTHRLARLRWRAPWWSPSTATRVRIFGRLGDAQAAADRLRGRGYSVELCTTERAPWRIVRPAPWSTGDRGEVVR